MKICRNPILEHHCRVVAALMLMLGVNGPLDFKVGFITNRFTALFTKTPALMLPGRFITSAGTILVEQKSVHWLSMGATGRNGPWDAFLPAAFLRKASN